MNLPPYGLCLPCTFVRARDGDTVEVRLRDAGFTWAVRMLDCWVTDNRESPLWRAAKDLVEREAQEASDEGRLAVFLPIFNLPANPLSALTFDRVLGHVFISSDTTLAELLVRRGLAGRTKQGEPR
jgi:endonuclease YncB( thermonuclease family)